MGKKERGPPSQMREGIVGILAAEWKMQKCQPKLASTELQNTRTGVEGGVGTGRKRRTRRRIESLMTFGRFPQRK